MPELRQRERAAQAELSSLASQESEKETYLRLAETVSSFFARLKETAHALDAAGRNKIVRLLVKNILVDDESITYRDSFPAMPGPSDNRSAPPKTGAVGKPEQCYALRSGRHYFALGRAAFACLAAAHAPGSVLILFLDRCLQPHLDEAQHIAVHDTSGDRFKELGVRDRF